MNSPTTIDTPSSFRPRIATQYRRYEMADLVGTMTEEEFSAFDLRSREKHQLIQGKVVRMPGSSPEHNMILMDTCIELGNLLAASMTGCEVLGSDQKVYVSPQTIFYPDVIVVCGEPQFDHLDALRNPTGIFEVLSPSTEKGDRADKFYDYQKIESLQHYILVEQDRIFVTHYEKIPGGLWAIVGTHTESSDSLKLNLSGKEIAVSLARIYRRVTLLSEDSQKQEQ